MDFLYLHYLEIIIMHTLSAWVYTAAFERNIARSIILSLNKALSKVTLDLIDDPAFAPVSIYHIKKRPSNCGAVTSASRDGFTERSMTDALIEPRFCVSKRKLFPFWHTRLDRLRRVSNRDRLLVNYMEPTLRSPAASLCHNLERELNSIPQHLPHLMIPYCKF